MAAADIAEPFVTASKWQQSLKADTISTISQEYHSKINIDEIFAIQDLSKISRDLHCYSSDVSICANLIIKKPST